MDKHKQLAVRVIETLRKNGFEAYFAGGCVRDMIMKRIACDYDIATNARPEQVEKIFKKTIAVGKKFGVITAII